MNNSILPENSKSLKGNVKQKYEAAAYYAKFYKWHVFPVHSIRKGQCTCGKNDCSHPGKHPITAKGLNDATINQNLIKQWWKAWDDANIGIATGRVSNFVVIDIDEGGEESIESLTEQFGPLTNTVESVTGSGGRHILYKYPENYNGIIKNRVELFPGIDIRGDKGYIIVPPSLHLSGRHYEWELSSRPNEVQLREMPEWFLRFLVQPKDERVEKKPTSHWTYVMHGLREGQGRNMAAASLAGHLFRRFLDPNLVVEIMKLWNKRNIPPLTNDELYKTINSIAGTELSRRKRGNKNVGT